jgi:hypothetical protein
MPAQGTLIGRFYENVTDSSEVKSQFLFQVACFMNASKFGISQRLLCASQVGMSDPLSGNVRPNFLVRVANLGLLTFLAVQTGTFIGRAVSIWCFAFGR